MLHQSQFIDETKKWNTRTTIGGLVENDIAKAGKSYAPDSVIKYIDISSVDNSTNTITGTTEFIFKEAPSRAQQCIETGDILVSTVRPKLKNIAVNHLTDSNLIASSGFCVLRPKEGYTGLLLAYILSDEFTEMMSLVAKGTNYPAVHDSDILDYEVTIPQGEEIGKIDALYKQADKSKFGGFKSQFIEDFYNRYESTNLGEHISVIRGVSYKPTDIRESSDNAIAILRSNNISDGEINFDDLVYVSQTCVSEKQFLSTGDIVMCGSNGSKKLVGKAGLMADDQMNTSFGAFCLGIRCKETLAPEYLNAYFNSRMYRSIIEELGNGTNIINIRPDHITSLSIPIPEKDVQNKFVAISRQADKSKYMN